MQALYARDPERPRPALQVSLLDAVAATMVYDTVTFQYTGLLRTGQGRLFALISAFIATLRC
jgi:hypothetical protein